MPLGNLVENMQQMKVQESTQENYERGGDSAREDY